MLLNLYLNPLQITEFVEQQNKRWLDIETANDR
jgi:hypothetical protein